MIHEIYTNIIRKNEDIMRRIKDTVREIIDIIYGIWGCIAAMKEHPIIYTAIFGIFFGIATSVDNRIQSAKDAKEAERKAESKHHETLEVIRQTFNEYNKMDIQEQESLPQEKEQEKGLALGKEPDSSHNLKVVYQMKEDLLLPYTYMRAFHVNLEHLLTDDRASMELDKYKVCAFWIKEKLVSFADINTGLGFSVEMYDFVNPISKSYVAKSRLKEFRNNIKKNLNQKGRYHEYRTTNNRSTLYAYFQLNINEKIKKNICFQCHASDSNWFVYYKSQPNI